MKEATGFAGFLARVFSNGYQDAFTTRLGVNLLLAKFGIVGPAANLLSPILRGVVGLLIEDGTFLIDVSIDAYREGKKIPEFEKAASEAYKKATAKIYDETQKNEIRKQYIEILAKIVPVGNGPKS
jgi:hypothetical protein